MNSERPIKILHVLGGMVRGGVETLLMHLLRSIDRNRYRIDILTHTEQPCPYDDEVRALGSRLIPCMGHPNPWIYANNFRRAVRQNGPYDVIHAHMFYFNALIMWLAARERIPNTDCPCPSGPGCQGPGGHIVRTRSLPPYGFQC